jgi:tetratricopeptide (TPR) repeat protein
MIEYHFFGADPWIYHLNNLLLHIVNGLLVFWLIIRINKKTEMAFFVAVLFAIHPMHVESVAWLSERKDLLYAFFFIGALISYIYFLENTKKISFLILCFLLFALSVLSKSAAVSLPIVLFLFDYYYRRKLNLKLILEKVPFLILSIVFGLINIYTQKTDQFLTDISDSYSFFERILLVSYSVSFYVVKAFIPVNLSAKYFYPIKTDGFLPIEYYLSVLLILLLVALLFVKKIRRDYIFGFGFFAITIALVLKIIPTGNDIVSDRYTYLPYLGIFYFVYSIIDSTRLLQHKLSKSLLIFIFVAVSLIFIKLSSDRVKVWKDPVALWSDVIEKNPQSPVAYNERGQAYADRKQYEKAMIDLNRSIQLNRRFSLAYNNRGLLKNEMKEYESALDDFNQAIEIDNSNAELFVNRGKAHASLSDLEKAARDFEKAIQLDKNQFNAFNNLGIVYAQIEKYDSALTFFNESLRLNPYQEEAITNRGFTYFKMGDYDNAKKDLYSVPAYHSKPQLLIYLAQSELNTDNSANAIQLLNRLLRLTPKNMNAVYLRANLFASTEQYNKAIRDYNTLLNLQPDNATILLKRGNCYFSLNDFNKACNDWQKAAESGNEEALTKLDQHCKKYN